MPSSPIRASIAAACAVVLLLPTAAWAAAPNDPRYSYQWGLVRIKASDAWRASTGRGVVIAVVDTGVDASHPDLRGRVLTGRDFVDDDGDASDENGHGTLIAGIIAASTNNRRDIAAVAPDAKILPVRVLDAEGNGESRDVREGVRWALDRGATVINLSLAHSDGDLDGLLRDPSVDLAIREASERGATVVVAAGNDATGGNPETSYSTDYPGVLVVGASTRDDRRAAYSNYGDGLDLVAPGGGSATRASAGGCNSDNYIVSTWWNPESGRSTLGGACGTSMAVAFVSGVAALLHAEGFSNAKVADRIVDTVDDIDARGRDAQTGHGRLNAARALGVRPAGSPTARVVPRRTTKLPTPKSTVRTQASPTPIVTRAPTVTPTGAAREPVLAFAPSRPTPTSRSAPVSLALFLVAALTAAHVLRFARR